jgi:hypothetical protein
VEELEKAIRNGKKNKSSGQDGVCHEFFASVWDFARQDLLDL